MTILELARLTGRAGSSVQRALERGDLPGSVMEPKPPGAKGPPRYNIPAAAMHWWQARKQRREVRLLVELYIYEDAAPGEYLPATQAVRDQAAAEAEAPGYCQDRDAHTIVALFDAGFPIWYCRDDHGGYYLATIADVAVTWAEPPDTHPLPDLPRVFSRLRIALPAEK